VETLLVVVVVAAAILWAVLRIRRTARGAAGHPCGARVGAPACPGCTTGGQPPATCDLAATCDVSSCREARGAGRPGPPR
jgi:hypothetical protein